MNNLERILAFVYDDIKDGDTYTHNFILPSKKLDSVVGEVKQIYELKSVYFIY